jgi:hypothetical protein
MVVNKEVEMTWKEATVAQLEILFQNLRRETKKATKNIS